MDFFTLSEHAENSDTARRWKSATSDDQRVTKSRWVCWKFIKDNDDKAWN